MMSASRLLVFVLPLLLGQAESFKFCHSFAHVILQTPCARRCKPLVAADDASLTLDSVREMFKDVRAHYRKTGEVEEGQVCQNLMVTRVRDFANRLDRCCVQPSKIHGDGLFASRSIEAGELVTFFPGDALLVWESGDRDNSDMMMFFGGHVPQSERDASEIANERVRHYELYSSARISAVGDPSRREDSSYLGHFANDASTCRSPDDIDAYRRESSSAANVEPVLLESCHFGLRALRPIDYGEEILFSYGEGYWLARNGHAGVGSDLRCIGTAAPSRDQGERLKQALKRSRPQKKKKAGSAGKRGTKPKSKSKPESGTSSRGFG